MLGQNASDGVDDSAGGCFLLGYNLLNRVLGLRHHFLNALLCFLLSILQSHLIFLALDFIFLLFLQLLDSFLFRFDLLG